MTGTPRQAGQFRRTDETWDIFLHARDDPRARRGAYRIRVAVAAGRISSRASIPGTASRLDGIELEPEVVSGLSDTVGQIRRPARLSASAGGPHPGRPRRRGSPLLRAPGDGLPGRRGARSGSTSAGARSPRAAARSPSSSSRTSPRASAHLGPEAPRGAPGDAARGALRKTQILEAYVNTIYLGQHGNAAIYGVGAAARSYFGKDLSTARARRSRPPRRDDPGAQHLLRRPRTPSGPASAVGVLRAHAGPRFIDRRRSSRRPASACGPARARGPGSWRPTSSTTFARPGARAQVEDGGLGRGGSASTPRSIPCSSARPRPRSSAGSTGSRAATGTSGGRDAAARLQGGPGGPRPRDRRDPRARRRARLCRDPVQPRHPRAPPARLRLQAVRLPGGARRRPSGRAAARSRPSRVSMTAPHARRRRPHLEPAELRGPVRGQR